MAGEDDVSVRFGANIGGAIQGIDDVGHKLKDLDGPVREVIESFGQLRKTFVEAFAVREIAEFVEHIADLGEQAVRNSAMLGMSVESVQKLGFAAKMTGGDAEGMATSLMRLERNMAEAQSGSGKAYEAFQSLGISLNDLKNKSPEQVLGMIADAFKGAEDGAAKTAVAMDLMGRSGAQMIPILDEGAEGLGRMGELAEQTGSVLTTLEAEGLERTAQEITTLKASVEGVGISLMGVFKPAIDALIQGLTSLVQTLRAAIEMIRVLVDLIEGGIATAIAGVIEKFEEFGASASNAIGNIKTGFVTLGTVIDDVIHGHFEKAADAWVEGTNKIRQANADTAAQIAKIGQAYDSVAEKIAKATAAALTFGASEQKQEKAQLKAPTTGGAGDDSETKIEEDSIKTEEQLAKIGLQTQKDILEQEVAAKQISKAQEYAALQEYLQLEYQVEAGALDKKLALYGDDEVKYQETLNQKAILDAQFQQQMARLATQGAQAQAQAAKKTQEEWKPVLDTIGRDFDTMLAGVLQGTATWQSAMANMFSNLAVSAVEAIAKIIAEWLVFEAVTEGQGTWGDFMALEGSGQGGVGNQLIKSFDVGSWSVPNDQLAFIHQNEMIIPAQQASAIRSGGASLGSASAGATGGGSMNITINAVDAQSVANLFKSNGAVLASVLAGQSRNFNPNLRM